jgi:hypothetical protein
MYFIFHWVFLVSSFFLSESGVLPIHPYIQISISSMGVSITPSWVVWLLVIFWWLCLVTSIWQALWPSTSYLYEDLGFTSCSSRDTRDTYSVLTFWGTFLISCFLLQNLSEWLVIQVGYFSHRKCPESIIPYQLFVFTQLNLWVGLAHLGEIPTRC